MSLMIFVKAELSLLSSVGSSTLNSSKIAPLFAKADKVFSRLVL